MRIPPGYVPTTPLGPAPHGEPALKDARPRDERLRLRIESDGTASGTRVIDAHTGRMLPVQAVTWSMDVQDGTMRPATATIVVPLVEVAVSAEARVEGALHFAYPPLPSSASADEKTQ